MIETVLHSVGSLGFFASRAFLPAFMTAAALRWGEHLPWIEATGLARGGSGAPTWFTSDACLGVLGLLSVLEMIADKSPDLRVLLGEFDTYLKSAMAGLTYLGVMAAGDVEYVEGVIREGGFGDYGGAMLVMGGVWWLGTLRNGTLGLLRESDDDDDAGIQGLISWAEDVWAAFGIWILILYPAVMVALLGLVTGGMLLARRRAEAREEQSRRPCASCGEPVYQCAVACGGCGATLAEPRAIGWTGATLETPCPDPADHAFRLAEKKRCPVCATRLTERDVTQSCPACGHAVFGDGAFAAAYAARIGARLPKVLVVSALFSLVPVIGLIPGVIYYRLALVAPFRRYVPRGRAFLTKWAIRLLFLVLIVGQAVPGVGAVAVPLMALVNYVTWKGQYQTLLTARSA